MNEKFREGDIRDGEDGLMMLADVRIGVDCAGVVVCGGGVGRLERERDENAGGGEEALTGDVGPGEDVAWAREENEGGGDWERKLLVEDWRTMDENAGGGVWPVMPPMCWPLDAPCWRFGDMGPWRMLLARASARPSSSLGLWRRFVALGLRRGMKSGPAGLRRLPCISYAGGVGVRSPEPPGPLAHRDGASQQNDNFWAGSRIRAMCPDDEAPSAANKDGDVPLADRCHGGRPVNDGHAK